MPSQYGHPGEVRKARNFRCYHCGTVCSTPQGIMGHLHFRHKVAAPEVQHAIDWGVTKETACDNTPMPVASR